MQEEFVHGQKIDVHVDAQIPVGNKKGKIAGPNRLLVVNKLIPSRKKRDDDSDRQEDDLDFEENESELEECW